MSLPPRAPDPEADAVTGAPLRVAAVIQSYLPVLGGAQTQVQQLGPLYARRGVQTVVLTRRVPATPAVQRTDGLLIRRLIRRLVRWLVRGPAGSTGAAGLPRRRA